MQPRRTVRPLLAAGALGVLVAFSASARADVNHVVAPGHTIDAIARRYHVTVKAIMDANHLKSGRHLTPGMTLVIPGVQPRPAHGAQAQQHGAQPAAHGAQPAHGAPAAMNANAAHGHGAAATPPPPHHGETPNAIAPAPLAHGPSFEATPRQPDVVHMVRFNEEATIRVKDRRGKIPPPALHQVSHVLRSGNAEHEIDPRLVALLGMVSNHFGGRKIQVVSGFRPFSPTQYTAHSNHNQGRAIDFRVEGVPNEVLRDFCKTLRNVGVGYYPNSVFVHLDVRDAPAFWVDYSRPGEPPRYDRPTPNADEASSDVGDDSRDTEPSATPSAPAAVQSPTGS